MSVMRKPELFTEGTKVNLRYRSTQPTRNDSDKGAVGFIIKDSDGVLVIEEYHNYERVHENRHVLLDTETMDVYSQTEKQTMRIGQAVELKMWAPPWESDLDIVAGGMSAFAAGGVQKYRMIEEGIYTYPDPDRLDQPEDWTGETTDPIPDEMQERNSEGVYHPPVDTDI